MNWFSRFWNAKQPPGTDWVVYALLAAVLAVLAFIVVISR